MFKVNLPPDTGPMYTYTTCCECEQLRARVAELEAERDALKSENEYKDLYISFLLNQISMEEFKLKAVKYATPLDLDKEIANYKAALAAEEG